MKHFTHPALNDFFHIHLAGCGGTGTLLLGDLARVYKALRSLGHPGFGVTAFDPDHVSPANLGRQLFSESDIGRNKAVVTITRLNQFYGLGWKAEPVYFSSRYALNSRAEFLMTAVDTAKVRIEISRFKEKYLYWLDCGNTKDTGQVVLGTGREIKQPRTKGAMKYLPSVTDLYDLAAVNDDDQGPSCSLADALEKQDIMINRDIASLALKIFWKMIRHGGIHCHGGFVDLDALRSTPLNIDPLLWRRMGWIIRRPKGRS